MARALDNDFLLTYAKKPSEALVKLANEEHPRVRKVLGDSDYETFLQGSYKNGTALEDMNDVDIVAVRRSPPTHGTLEERWAFLARDVTQRLQQEPRFTGRWTREDKCIRLNTQEGLKIDIVPAISASGNPASDPITLYSVRERRETKNWPRGHQEGARRKGTATNGHYKQAVRLFKWWRNCHFSSRRVAPSYYLECLLYSMPDKLFGGDLATWFVELARTIGHRFPDARAWHSQTLPRLAGKGNLLSSEEWGARDFEQFRSALARSLLHAERAMAALDKKAAQDAWRAAFNGR
jgi:hypothetical protein